MSAATWPEGVIARYLTVGGGIVDVVERSGSVVTQHNTETHVTCSGCPTTYTVEWGWDEYHAEFGSGPQKNFDEGGKQSTPVAREWAQSHAEKCRAVPRPEPVR